MNSKLRTGLVFLFVAFLLLLSAPLLSLPTGLFAGVPSILIYIMIVWISLIFSMALIFTNRNSKKG